uniref:SRP1A n=1 Tax=Arundo donax TaxID=35708 RepID=A0A0A9DAE8_ARUDO
MRPVFVGNLDYDPRHSELDRLFYRYGRIERIDMKSGPNAPLASPPSLISARSLLSTSISVRFDLMLLV